MYTSGFFSASRSAAAASAATYRRVQAPRATVIWARAMIDPRDETIERLLTDAGIEPGMRVVDVGCGVGRLALVLARRVGEAGAVVGVDRDPRALDAARAAVAAQATTRVSFVESDLATVPTEVGTFDAMVGRRVLIRDERIAREALQLPV